MARFCTKMFLTLTDPSDCRLASRIAGEDYEKVKSTTFTEANKKAAPESRYRLPAGGLADRERTAKL
ncbi:MAG: hypothetical protein MZV64_71455 [Ignavibacteriales bacterium]|nr:hypothetical protein [Ignavibacteriales bacterium]